MKLFAQEVGCLAVCLSSLSGSVCLAHSLSVCLFVFLTAPNSYSSVENQTLHTGGKDVCLAVWPSISPSVCVYVCLSVCISVCLYVCLCACLSNKSNLSFKKKKMVAQTTDVSLKLYYGYFEFISLDLIY